MALGKQPLRAPAIGFTNEELSIMVSKRALLPEFDSIRHDPEP